MSKKVGSFVWLGSRCKLIEPFDPDSFHELEAKIRTVTADIAVGDLEYAQLSRNFFLDSGMLTFVM